MTKRPRRTDSQTFDSILESEVSPHIGSVFPGIGRMNDAGQFDRP